MGILIRRSISATFFILFLSLLATVHPKRGNIHVEYSTLACLVLLVLVAQIELSGGSAPLFSVSSLLGYDSTLAESATKT